MATDTIEIPNVPTGLSSVTAKLFAQGSDTVVATLATVTERTNSKTVYRTTTTAGATGWHKIVLFDSGGVGFGGWWVNLTNTGAVHYARDDDPGLAADFFDYLASHGADIADSVNGSDVTVYRGTKWSIPLLALGDLTGYTRIYFTVRRNPDTPDAASLCQIRLSNPSSGDGLLYFNGAPATANQGSLTVDNAVIGNITLVVEATTTANGPHGDYEYDVKLVTASNVTLRSIGGKFKILPDITRAVA